MDKSIYYQRHLKWLVSLAFLAASTTCLVAQNPLPAVPAITRTLTMKEIFAFLFLMLGPLKILGPFAQLTAGCDGIFTRRLAVRAIIISCASLAFVALIGEKSMSNYHISVPVLAIAAGIILFLVALRTVLQQFDFYQPATQHQEDKSLRLAVTPLAFPIIVTPYGIAAVIIFMSLTPDLVTRGEIAAVLLALMSLNLVAMLFARPILKYAGMPMQLLGIVLGIIQVALGLQIIVAGVRQLTR